MDTIKREIVLFKVAECFESITDNFNPPEECPRCGYPKSDIGNKLHYVVSTSELFVDTFCSECKVVGSQLFTLTKDEYNELVGEKYRI